MELSNPKHQFHNIISVSDSHKIFKVLVKEVRTSVEEKEDREIYTPENDTEESDEDSPIECDDGHLEKDSNVGVELGTRLIVSK